jgi:hypothetical protein
VRGAPFHLSGKERDAESGNRYFGAHSYSSAIATLRAPERSANVEPVPYAKLGDPQNPNLDSYCFSE